MYKIVSFETVLLINDYASHKWNISDVCGLGGKSDSCNTGRDADQWSFVTRRLLQTHFVSIQFWEKKNNTANVSNTLQKLQLCQAN